MNKRLFIFGILIVIGIPLFAEGASEVLQSTAVGAGSGAAVGTAFGGVGAIPGAVIGGVVGFFKGLFSAGEAKTQKGLDYNDRYLEQKQAIVGYETDIDLAEENTTDAERRISAYDQTLADWNQTQSLAESNLLSEGQGQYSQQMQNFQNIQTSMSAKGQTGGSSQILSDVAQKQVEKFAGEDLTLNRSGGGTFSQIWDNTQSEFRDNKASTLLGKQDLYKSISIYNKNIKTNMASIDEAKGLRDDYKEDAIKYGVKYN